MPKSPNHAGPSRPGFLGAWDRLMGPYVPRLPVRAGRKPRVAVPDLLATMAFHVMQPAGPLSQHFSQLFQAPLADSSWSDRRQRLPWELFAELMRRVLRPRAQARRDPEAFWRGWRLLGIDGTQFSLRNTPAITARTRKARTRRGRAAFAKLTVAVLLELGAHNPLAAGLGRHGESEWALARRLLAQLPRRALLLADRLYGVTAFAAEAQAACASVGSHFLLRARGDIRRRVLQRLPDGSCLVRVAVRDRARPAQIVGHVDLREIRARVQRRGRRPHPLRLWTTLCDPTTAPALELAQLYARRWEQELYFREVKRQLHRTALLQSHTVETAAQEVAALVLASAILADDRLRAAGGQVPALRLSFGAVLEITRGMWFTVQLAADLLTAREIATVMRRGQRWMRQCRVPERRGRSCPRAVRQPTRPWPRLLHPASSNDPVQITVLRHA